MAKLVDMGAGGVRGAASCKLRASKCYQMFRYALTIHPDLLVNWRAGSFGTPLVAVYIMLEYGQR